MALVSSILIEVCVDSVESARNAAHAGADRLELCANLGLGGGTTPSLGLLKSVQKAMIRPRTGDFCYSDQELEVMLEDIRVFKEHDVRGIAVGVLDKDGRVDAERMKSRHLENTHKVDSINQLHKCINHGDTLFSGHGKTAPDALATLQSFFRMTKELIEDKPWGLTVLPGSGVNPTTITPILDALLPLGLQEIHLSGSHWIDGGMSFRREGMGMGAGGEGEWGIWMVDREKVSEVREIADKYWESYHGRDE
ncbi:hypothetical protein C0989_005716 [Termitomyces sp. Mn162]|nr:hypothetical protein C0989_005716 [Termitomyces sp. Mn162]